EHGWPAPATEPKGLRLAQVRSDRSALRSLRDAREAADLPELPEAGEDAALRRWAEFRDDALADYGTDRNRADLPGVSRLSPYLKVGAVHPRTLLADLADGRRKLGDGAERYATELAWREFYADVLWHQPRSAWHDLRPALSG